MATAVKATYYAPATTELGVCIEAAPATRVLAAAAAAATIAM